MGANMRYFLPQLAIGEDEGFSSEKDIFGRKLVGDGLANLLSASSDPLVLAVNGRWGSGKTVFLKMWAGELRNAGYPVVYFDAFEHDYLSDAFTAIAGEIIDLERQKKGGSGEFKDKALSVGKVLLRAGLVCAAKVATAGVLSAGDIEGCADELKTAAGDAADKLLEKALTARNEDRQTMQAFRQALGGLPKLLSKEDADEQVSHKPLVFIIDELDRCRPTFALEVLERVKHFFSVSNVHFVLGVNIEQLENSIAAAYGTGIDAKTYLQKFLSLTVELDVQPGSDRHVHNSAKFVAYLVREMEFQGENLEAIGEMEELICIAARQMGLSLRELERIMSLSALALGFTSNRVLRVPPIIVGLCMMRVLSPDLYRKAKVGQLTYSDAETFFDLSKLRSDVLAGSSWFVEWWRYCLEDDVDAQIVRRYESVLFEYEISERENIIPITANNVIDRFAMAK
jgi:hypothetical protein